MPRNTVKIELTRDEVRAIDEALTEKFNVDGLQEWEHDLVTKFDLYENLCELGFND